MKNLLCKFCILLLLINTGCSVSDNFIKSSTTFTRKGKDYIYELTLNPDGTCIYSKSFPHLSKECNCHWLLHDKKELIIECDEEDDLIVTLTEGYMSDRNHVATIINYRKLKINNKIYKRKR